MPTLSTVSFGTLTWNMFSTIWTILSSTTTSLHWNFFIPMYNKYYTMVSKWLRHQPDSYPIHNLPVFFNLSTYKYITLKTPLWDWAVHLGLLSITWELSLFGLSHINILTTWLIPVPVTQPCPQGKLSDNKEICNSPHKNKDKWI